MTKEQEAQQAQTMAEINERHKKRRWIGVWPQLGPEDWATACRDISFLKDLANSQAQKIAEQEKRIAELEKAAEFYVRKIESWGI